MSRQVTLWDDLAANEGQEIEDAMKTSGVHVVALARTLVST